MMKKWVLGVVVCLVGAVAAGQSMWPSLKWGGGYGSTGGDLQANGNILSNGSVAVDGNVTAVGTGGFSGGLTTGGNLVTTGGTANVGVVDNTAGQLRLYGDSSTGGGWGRWYNAASEDTETDYFEWVANGDLELWGVDGSSNLGKIFHVDKTAGHAVWAKNWDVTGTLKIGGTQIGTDDLLDAGNIGMLNEAETVAGNWSFGGTLGVTGLLTGAGGARFNRSGTIAQNTQLLNNSGGNFLDANHLETNKKPLLIRSLHDGSGSPSGSGGFAFYVGPASAPVLALTITEAGVVTPATALIDSAVSNTLTASLLVGSGSTTGAVDLATAEVAGELPTANVANDAITYAKMQNVSSTDRLLGRISGGAGDVEQILITDFFQTLFDDADAATARATLGVSNSWRGIARGVDVAGAGSAASKDLGGGKVRAYDLVLNDGYVELGPLPSTYANEAITLTFTWFSDTDTGGTDDVDLNANLVSDGETAGALSGTGFSDASPAFTVGAIDRVEMESVTYTPTGSNGGALLQVEMSWDGTSSIDDIQLISVEARY